MRGGLVAFLFASFALGSALADSLPRPNPFARFADPNGVVLAVETPFVDQGGSIRVSVYGSEEEFLENALIKTEGELGDDGVAIIPIGALPLGQYAFVAYFDENDDNRLNRGFVGRPKEPYAFSNGVRPKLSKPDFKDAKLDVGPGSVVVLSIDD
ncbi:MAG: DUF2141 domain-containing protein [Pseudomonadota bacterium]